MYFNLIGAGRLGKLIARELVNSGRVKLGAVCNKGFPSAIKAVEQIGTGIAVSALEDLPPSDITFISTPDDRIPQISEQLAREKLVRPGSIVIHTSGVLSSIVLRPLQELNCPIASFHPLRAFRATNSQQDVFKQCDCVIEGDEIALQTLSSLFIPLNARMILLQPENKAVYHAAAVFASNYLVTLAATATELFQQAGITVELAKEITTNLMTSSINNIQKTQGLNEALTGPLLRGDQNTLSLHLQALPKDLTLDFYRICALLTLNLTSLNEEQKKQITDLLCLHAPKK